MFGQRKPSEIAAQLKTEYSPHSPAMRLTLVNYTLQYGIPTSFEGTPREFLDELMGFVSAEYDEFSAELDETFEDDQETIGSVTDRLDGEGGPGDVIDFDPNNSPYL